MRQYFVSFFLVISLHAYLLTSLGHIKVESPASDLENKTKHIQILNVKINEPKINTPKKIEKKHQEKLKTTAKIPTKTKRIESKTVKNNTKIKVNKPPKKEFHPTAKTSNKIQKENHKIIKKDAAIKEKIKRLENIYFKTINIAINKNKSYPKRAIKRRLQGDIKVEFIISPKGDLISLNIINGKKVFYKSTRKAIEKSFPITPQNGIFSSNTKIKLTLSYRLN